jgi:hypothetical protein
MVMAKPAKMAASPQPARKEARRSMRALRKDQGDNQKSKPCLSSLFLRYSGAWPQIRAEYRLNRQNRRPVTRCSGCANRDGGRADEITGSILGLGAVAV